MAAGQPLGEISDGISDGRATALFLDMMASERGAAKNTIAAYGRDLAQASAACGGDTHQFFGG